MTHGCNRYSLDAEEGLFALSPTDSPVSVVSHVSVTAANFLHCSLLYLVLFPTWHSRKIQGKLNRLQLIYKYNL